MKPAATIPAERPPWLALFAIAVVAVVAYHNSLSGAFVFDDPSSIANNPTLRRLWPPWAPLSPPNAAITVQGRPILNLSLALNYAVGGTAVAGYHAMNLAIHLIAALALFGLVRRTLRWPAVSARFGSAATPLACVVALLWVAHPLQTEAVTYVIQRAESLMGMFYLLTLYAFVRAAQSDSPTRWFALAIVTCAFGMATKEVMVSAPVLVLLYDRCYVAGSFSAAWRQRGRFYFGLASTWLWLAWLVIGTGGNRGGSAGFDVGVGPWDYWETQFEAIAHYLRLALWPRPLVFEYGTFWIENFWRVLPAALVVAAAVAGVGLALWRNTLLAFPAAFFFAILSVTSLVPGTTQMIVEHRMYLPLAALAAGFAVLLHASMGRRALPAGALAAGAMALLTVARNEDYRSELALWADTVAKRPDNALARVMYGQALDGAGRNADAAAQFEAAVKIFPKFALAHDNLGQDLARQGRFAKAITHYETAVRLNPQFADAHNNLGTALAQTGRSAEARAEYEHVLRLNPEFAEAHYNLANLLGGAGDRAEAIHHYESALRIRPSYFEAQYNLANTLADAGRHADAVAHYEAAIGLQPTHARTYYNFGNTLVQLGRLPEAITQYEQAVRAAPEFLDAHFNLGTALFQQGRATEALAQYEAALRLKPDATEIQAMVARVRAALRNSPQR